MALLLALPLEGTLSGCRPRETKAVAPTPTGPSIPASQQRTEAYAIGMLVPTRGPRRSLGDEAKAAAAMAVEEANAASKGRRFVLRVRADDGPWGSQAREAAALIYDEGCCVFVAGLDGRVTHVVEQVATKAQIPVVTPWASEDTVTQAGVPWVFRCVPNDRQQAAALLNVAWANGPPALLVEASFDGRGASRALHRAAQKAGKSFALEAEVPGVAAAQQALTRRVAQSGAGAVVMLGGSEGAAAMLPALRRQAPKLPVFASLEACTPQLLAAAGEQAEAVRVPWPAAASSEGLADFARRYEQRNGARPTPLAAFTYDTVSLVAEALRQVGPSREQMQRFLGAADRQGVTGRIRFDRSGNRVGRLDVVSPPLMGRPLLPTKA